MNRGIASYIMGGCMEMDKRGTAIIVSYLEIMHLGSLESTTINVPFLCSDVFGKLREDCNHCIF